jgi:hypothetical protein
MQRTIRTAVLAMTRAARPNRTGGNTADLLRKAAAGVQGLPPLVDLRAVNNTGLTVVSLCVSLEVAATETKCSL